MKVLRFGSTCFVSLWVGVFLSGCGRHSLSRIAPFSEPAGVEGGKKLSLVVFGTSWSAETQSAVPALQVEINRLDETDRKALDLIFYVPTGSTPGSLPTQADAERLGSALGIKGRAIADEWRWKNFRKYFSGQFAVPAAAVVDLDGRVLKTFSAGPTSFIPQEIAAFVKGALPRGNQVTLALFGAPWCSECKTEMPAIQAELDKLSRTQASFVDVVLYVTTSGNPSVPPTQEVADQYRSVLHIKAKALPDEWRWKNFRRMVGGSFVLPGAALLDSSGNVVRAFRAGPTDFVPSEIVSSAIKLTK